MLLVLSPSKGQDFSCPMPTCSYTTPEALDQSQLLINSVLSYSPEGLAKLMSMSDRLAQLNWVRFREFSTPFTPENGRPALYAFQGDVYSAIPVGAYGTEQLDYAQRHLRILSGLYGALRPLDLIQPYRLEMKTKLPNPRGANLYQFWGDRITGQLNRQLEAMEEPLLVNLASNEYFKAVRPKALAGRILTINFKEERDGKARTLAIFAKRARGMMADYIISQRLRRSADICGFDRGGYRYRADLSCHQQLTFTRPQLETGR